MRHWQHWVSIAADTKGRHKRHVSRPTCQIHPPTHTHTPGPRAQYTQSTTMPPKRTTLQVPEPSLTDHPSNPTCQIYHLRQMHSHAPKCTLLEGRHSNAGSTYLSKPGGTCTRASQAVHTRAGQAVQTFNLDRQYIPGQGMQYNHSI